MNLDYSAFAQILIDWFLEHKRELPWRETKDPYRIWLSEIILQQTRVDQGLPYYLKFVETYPTVYDLAAAEEREVLRLWQGLGYYSRARNLHLCAREIVENYNGKFPRTFKDLKNLKGIGDYTAAAISSISFAKPDPVLDGNVYRVISRIFGVDEDIANLQSKKTFYKILHDLIPHDQPDMFNQGIMEFGAIHCTPNRPGCQHCIFKDQCFAYKNDMQSKLPVKLKRVKVSHRHFLYLVLVASQKVFLKPRSGKDIWAGLYDFPVIENAENKGLESHMSESQIAASILHATSPQYKHILSHQRITANFYVLEIKDLKPFSDILGGLISYNKQEVLNLPKPRLVDKYLNEEFFSLALIT